MLRRNTGPPFGPRQLLVERCHEGGVNPLGIERTKFGFGFQRLQGQLDVGASGLGLAVVAAEQQGRCYSENEDDWRQKNW